MCCVYSVPGAAYKIYLKMCKIYLKVCNIYRIKVGNPNIYLEVEESIHEGGEYTKYLKVVE